VCITFGRGAAAAGQLQKGFRKKKDKKITPSLRAALLEHLNQRKDSTKKKEKTMK
jgi:hypothetical protein